MYDLYKDRVKVMIPFVVVIASGGLALLYGGIKDLSERGFSLNTILFTLCSFVTFVIAYCFYLGGTSNPYEWVDQLKKDNPQRVRDMEEDFKSANELTYNIYKGNLNYYFQGYTFFAIPIGEICEIRAKEGYRRRTGRYLECEFTSSEGTVTLKLLFLAISKEEAVEVLNQLAFECHIDAILDID